MAALDWFWLVVLAFAVLQGIWRGLTQELFMFIGWLLVLAFSSLLARWIALHLPFETWSAMAKQALGFVLAVLAILITARLMGWLLRKVIVLVGLGWLDHLLGAVLGLLRGALILLLVVWVIKQTPIERLDFWQDSQGVTMALRGLSWLEMVLPSDFGKFIASCAESLASLVASPSTN
ncbi:MAG: hypothetical protein RL111_1824 [Pseudomonadota bacterium]|jgi:membrane protein required for colicin V production